MNTIETIKDRLSVLEPVSIEIIDDSAKHAGHKGNTGGGHYQLSIISAAFNTLNPVARHRKIYALLDDLMTTQIHALSIDAQPTDT